MSTTIDAELLASARELRRWASDAALLDAALTALVADHWATQIDASYRAYDDHPLSEDEWGDLESFREPAGSS